MRCSCHADAVVTFGDLSTTMIAMAVAVVVVVRVMSGLCVGYWVFFTLVTGCSRRYCSFLTLFVRGV